MPLQSAHCVRTCPLESCCLVKWDECDPGASWRIFNQVTYEQRQSMVLMYGNRKRLFGRWQVLTAAYEHTFFPMFGVQVCISHTSITHFLIAIYHNLGPLDLGSPHDTSREHM